MLARWVPDTALKHGSGMTGIVELQRTGLLGEAGSCWIWAKNPKINKGLPCHIANPASK
jgi:hypothetical protein